MNSSEHIPFLLEIVGEKPGRSYPIPFGEHTLGRDEQASVYLDDSDISRRHGLLRVEHARVTLCDLGSKNGIWLKNERLEGESDLQDGDRFELGTMVLELHHLGLRVDQILAAGGESTATHHRRRERSRPGTAAGSEESPKLLAPLLAVVFFLGLVAWILL